MCTHHSNISAGILVAAVFFSLTLSPAVTADTLTLESGDHLTGSLLNITSGTLTFRTTLAGRIFVPTNEVTALTTSSFVTIALKDNRILPGRIKTANNSIQLVSPNGKEVTTLQLAEIQEVTTLPATEVTSDEEDTRNNFQGSIAAGYKWRDGTKSASGPTLEIKLESETQKINFETQAELEYTEDADALDRFFESETRISKNTASSLSPEIFVALERNRNKALDYRAEIAVGANKILLDDSKQRLQGFAGVGGTIEKYDSDTLRRDQTGMSNAAESSVHDEDLNLNLDFKYTRRIFANSYMTERVFFRPSLTNFGDIRANLESSLTVPLPLGLQLKMDFKLDYDDETPYNDIDEWNSSIGASLKVNF